MAEEVEKRNRKAHLLQADLTTEQGCRELVQSISEKTDKLDVLLKLEIWRNDIPLKKHGAARHVAGAVKFILDNDFMTGATIDINGGHFMRICFWAGPILGAYPSRNCNLN